MNFLAHYLLATQYLPPPEMRSSYVVGNALPDLLPLAAPHKRLRPVSLRHAPHSDPEERAIRDGVSTHLRTDAAFHKTAAFQDAQVRVGRLITRAGFAGIRVRGFFLAHVLTELALDAALLRSRPHISDQFYRDFANGSTDAVTRWAEAAVGQALPKLPTVLARFADARYLASYATDDGVAEGLRRLSLRARQDDFRGPNRHRLIEVTAAAVTAVTANADEMLAETAATLETVPPD